MGSWLKVQEPLHSGSTEPTQREHNENQMAVRPRRPWVSRVGMHSFSFEKLRNDFSEDKLNSNKGTKPFAVFHVRNIEFLKIHKNLSLICWLDTSAPLDHGADLPK